MKNFLYFVSLSLLALSSPLFAQTKAKAEKQNKRALVQEKSEKQELKALEQIMDEYILGLFNNRLQVEADPEAQNIHGPQELRFVRIFSQRKDAYYVYCAWTSPKMPNEPLLQRIFRFDSKALADGSYVGEGFYVPENEELRGAWAKPEAFEESMISSLEADPCEVYFKKTGDEEYLMSTSPDCVSDNSIAPFKYYQPFMSFGPKGIACETIFFEDKDKELFRHNVYYDLQSRKKLDLPFSTDYAPASVTNEAQSDKPSRNK